MKLDTTPQPRPTLYHYFDYYGMPVIVGDIKSYLDSLGRLILMWIAYGMPDELEPFIEACLYMGKKHLELRRHPGTWDKSSRDHWSYFIIYRKLLSMKENHMQHNNDDDMFFKDFINDVPNMRGITIWKNALAGSEPGFITTSRSERKYYRTGIPEAKIGNIIFRILIIIGNFGPAWENETWLFCEDLTNNGRQELNTGTRYQRNRSTWHRWIGRFLGLVLPAHALHNKAWQLFVMPDSKKRDRIREILLRRVDHSNIVLRLLLNDRTVTLKEVWDYPNMSGYRPGVYLRPGTTFRDIHKLTDQEAAANCYEKKLATWLFTQNDESILDPDYE